MFGVVALVCLLIVLAMRWQDRRQRRRELERILDRLPPEARAVWEERNP